MEKKKGYLVLYSLKSPKNTDSLLVTAYYRFGYKTMFVMAILILVCFVD